MREYGQIQCSFWTDPDTQQLSDAAARLACYLLTGPHSNGLGCYRLPDGYIQADFGWTPQTVSKAFQELFETGFCKRCETTNFVLLPKFLRWNPIANANVGKAREKEFETVPKKASIRGALAASMLEFADNLSEPFRNRLETVSKQDPTRPDPEPDPRGEGKGASGDASPPPKNQVSKPDDIDDQTWSDFLAHRRTKKAKLTPTAWKQIRKQLDLGAAEGHDPNDMLAVAMAAGWQGFQFEWYVNRITEKPKPGAAASAAVEYRKQRGRLIEGSFR